MTKYLKIRYQCWRQWVSLLSSWQWQHQKNIQREYLYVTTHNHHIIIQVRVGLYKISPLNNKPMWHGAPFCICIQRTLQYLLSGQKRAVYSLILWLTQPPITQLQQTCYHHLFSLSFGKITMKENSTQWAAVLRRKLRRKAIKI